VLGINEGGRSTLLLGLGDDVQRQGRLSGRLRSVDLHHASPGDAAHPEREVQGHCPGRDGVDVSLGRRVVQLHDGALPIGALDLAEGGGQCAVFL